MPDRCEKRCSYLTERVEHIVTPNIASLLTAFREQQAPVVFLRVGGMRKDLSDTGHVVRENLLAYEALEGTWACDVIAELSPQPGELSLLKLGSGGFTTSNLDQHLRNMGVRTVLYTGVLTNVCVLLTAASGFDLGYEGFVVSDATATLSQPLQQATESIIDTFMARVVTTREALTLVAPSVASHREGHTGHSVTNRGSLMGAAESPSGVLRKSPRHCCRTVWVWRIERASWSSSGRGSRASIPSLMREFLRAIGALR